MKSSYIDRETLLRLKEATERAPRTRNAWLPFAVALETGLRIGDIVALPAEALRGNKLKYTAAKTGKEGEAELTSELSQQLKRGRNGKWLFPSPYKHGETHLSRQAAWKRIKAAAKRGEVAPEGMSPHSMRKTFAVELYARKGLAEVQRALQHTRVDVTEIYALADFLSAEKASIPLTRGDVPKILHLALDAVRAALSEKKA